MKTILLKFAGPLQSWGTDSHFETRKTDFYPSKSAIIGIIAASFGYERNEDEKIQELNKLDFAVRIDQQGQLLRDFHTATKYKNNGAFDRNYVTNRYYLEDSIFIVAIGHEDEVFMNKIEEALKQPYFQTYMGRRSLPLVADFFIGIRDMGVIESLQELPWQANGRRKKTHTSRVMLYADSDLVEEGVSKMRRDRVISFSQKERKFGFRLETGIEITIPISDDLIEHDALSALGG